jgi:hypothetical protein
MSLVDRLNKMSLIRLCLVGCIGFVWLFVMMLMVVGSIAALRFKLPGTIINAGRDIIQDPTKSVGPFDETKDVVTDMDSKQT